MVSSKVSIFVLWVCVQLNLAQVLTSYISWDDFHVDDQRLSSDPIENGRVIVVDKHGKGHSKTVQEAVDMISDNNPERIKIYIQPGTYRSICTYVCIYIKVEEE